MAVWNAKEIEAGLHGAASTVDIQFPKGTDLEKAGPFIRKHAHLQPIDFAVVKFVTSTGWTRHAPVFWFPMEFLAYIEDKWVNTHSIEAALVEYIRERSEHDKANPMPGGYNDTRKTSGD